MMCSSGGSGGSSGDISVKPLSSASAQHEEDECNDTGGDGETDDDKYTSDSASVIKEATTTRGRRG